MRRTYPLLGPVAAVSAFAGVTAIASASPAVASPTTICAAVPAGLTLVVNSGQGIGAVTSSAYEPIVDSIGGPAVAGARGPDGTAWAQRGGDAPAIVRLSAESPPTDVHAAAEIDLGTAGWLDGRSAAVFLDTTGVPEPTTEGIGAVVADFADGAQVTLSPAVWWEAGVSFATIGANRVVEGGGELVDDWFRSFGADGTEYDDWISPNNGDENPSYLAPAPAVSPDGTRAELSYLERGLPEGDGLWSDRYALVVADAVTGDESLRLDIGEDGFWPVRVDFDGRFWVGTFTAMANIDTPEPPAERVVVVDTEAQTPAAIDAGCAAGTIATIDKAGTTQPDLPDPSPPASTTSTPTSAPPASTAPPPTTAPGQCSDYTVADHDYPVQRCEQGGPVGVVQLMLIHRGYDIEQDGYFGPATESAVRQFQAGAGLEVDGLVGPDTWGALYDPERLPGVDNDGNGTVDPWEVTLDPGADSGEGSGGASGWIGRSFPYPQFATGEGGSSGTGEADGVTVWTVWPVGDGPAGAYHTLLLFPGGDSAIVLLAAGDGATPETLTVVDAIDVSQRSVLAIDCSLDGVLDPSVAALVTIDTTGPELALSTDVAWRSSAADEQIETLDPARVACSSNGLVAD